MKSLIDYYRPFLPLPTDALAISLGEGQTPLLPLPKLVRLLGKDIELYAKFEGMNPTGSFKDRGMTMAVSKALSDGAKAIICASTGNTSASAAAYGARAGMAVFVVLPENKIASGKMAQALAAGAIVLAISGNFDDGMQLVQEVSSRYPIALVNSVNPYRLQGQKTAAFEVLEELGAPPDYHFLPVGNAGNISAYWLGYCEATGIDPGFAVDSQESYALMQRYQGSLPKMIGIQAQGAAPFIQGAFVKDPETIATAIRIGAPQSWDKALVVQQRSKGWFAAVSDEEILAAQKLLCESEGIFCEPASAASIAGLINAIQKGQIEDGQKIVCTLTGHGLKDPEAISKGAILYLQPEFSVIEQAILEHLPT
jgi:threonine synthase